MGSQNIGGYAQDGRFDKRTGVGMSLGAPATILPCRDGHVWMLALEPGQWNGLVAAMGNPEWAQLEMFQDMFVRAQHADAMYPLLELWTMEHDKLDIMTRCQAAGCPVSAIFTVAEAAEHPHVVARGYVPTVSHPRLGRVHTLGAPFKLPACPGGPGGPSPLLGEHTAAVLAAPARSEAAPALAPREARRELPLAGIRVANFGWVWAGPVAGQTLGFLGADVVKVESRARVDLTRMLPPFAEGVRDPDRSLSNHAAWAGNGSVTLDLRSDEGRRLARELVAHSDVVIENFASGVMEAMGLGYDALRAVRPDLVMLSMKAAGLTGPLRDIRTYGLSVTSTTGLDSLTGYAGGPPIPVENAFADPYNGLMGAFAVLAALAHREHTGEGQHIDYSQQEAVMQMVGPALADWSLNGRVGGPLGNRHPAAAGAPHGVFPCAGDDRWVSIAVLADTEWQGLVAAMGRPAWAAAPELAGAAGRLHAIDTLHARLAEWTRAHDDRALAALLQSHGVAAAPVSNVGDLLADPHFADRRTFVEVTHPLGFRETIYGAYVKTTGPAPAVRPGPTMGQDNERIFVGVLGLAPEEYRRLVEARVIW